MNIYQLSKAACNGKDFHQWRMNQYCVGVVDRNANKIEIKQAVESCLRSGR